MRSCQWKGLEIFCCASVYFILFGGCRALFQVINTTLQGYIHNPDYTIVIRPYYHFFFMLRKVHWDEKEVRWDVKNVLFSLVTEQLLTLDSYLVMEGVNLGFYYFTG